MTCFLWLLNSVVEYRLDKAEVVGSIPTGATNQLQRRNSHEHQFFRKGELHYKTDDGFSFVVPADDVGDGVFLASDRAMLFMRYIRKQLEANAHGRELQDKVPN